MLRVLIWAVLGYVVGGFGGGLLVSALSTNTHDASLEAAMTGAFVTGPITAILAAIAGFFKARKQSRPARLR